MKRGHEVNCFLSVFTEQWQRPPSRSPPECGRICQRVYMKPLNRGLSSRPKPKPKQSETRRERGRRPGLIATARAATTWASFVLLSHFHRVRPLPRCGYVRHGRVLPLGGRLILHLLFLDQRRHVSWAVTGTHRSSAKRRGSPPWRTPAISPWSPPPLCLYPLPGESRLLLW